MSRLPAGRQGLEASFQKSFILFTNGKRFDMKDRNFPYPERERETKR
jgi:hypothetical protein